MRLIDADNMKYFVDDLYNCDGRADIIKRIIDQQPTAFDKEKVIEELQRHSHNYYPSIDHYCISEKAVKLREAIEIVEKGGIDD